MAWTVFLDQSTVEDGIIVIPVVFTDGNTKIPDTLRFPGSSALLDIQNTIQARLDKLNNIDVVKTKIPTGAFVAPVPVPPTPEETARTQFLSDVQIFRQMNRAVTLGLKTVLDPDYIALQKTIQGEFLDAYLPFL